MKASVARCFFRFVMFENVSVFIEKLDEQISGPRVFEIAHIGVEPEAASVSGGKGDPRGLSALFLPKGKRSVIGIVFERRALPFYRLIRGKKVLAPVRSESGDRKQKKHEKYAKRRRHPPQRFRSFNARSIVRFASRSAMLSRLSWSFFPLQRPTCTFTRLPLK